MSNTPSSLTMLTEVAVNLEPMLTRVEVIDVSEISVPTIPTVPTTAVTEVESVNFKDVKFSDVIITDLPTNVCHSNRRKALTRLRSKIWITLYSCIPFG